MGNHLSQHLNHETFGWDTCLNGLPRRAALDIYQNSHYAHLDSILALFLIHQ